MSRELDDPADAQASVDNQRLREENARLREALEKIANHWLEMDEEAVGKLARAALSQSEGDTSVVHPIRTIPAKLTLNPDTKRTLEGDDMQRLSRMLAESEADRAEIKRLVARAALSQSETPSPQCPRCGFTREVTKLE